MNVRFGFVTLNRHLIVPLSIAKGLKNESI